MPLQRLMEALGQSGGFAVPDAALGRDPRRLSPPARADEADDQRRHRATSRRVAAICSIPHTAVGVAVAQPAVGGADAGDHAGHRPSGQVPGRRQGRDGH